MNDFSNAVEVVLPIFEGTIEVLDESYSMYVSITDPKASHDVEQVLNSRNSLSEMVNLARQAKEGMVKFRDSILAIGKQEFSNELKNAASRQSQVLEGIISNLEQLESFALRMIFLINEKFGGSLPLEDKAE